MPSAGWDAAAMLPVSWPLADVLPAAAPDPELAEELALFGRLIGSWNLAITDHRADGSSRTVPGEWHFGWVLEGLAVQDVWICPSHAHRAATGARREEVGTSLRFYDRDLGAWRSTWIGPGRGVVGTFTARAEGDEIVLRTARDDGTLWRWTFSNLTADAFDWRNERSSDAGETWTLAQTFAARRA
jgi:hypothetical protein